MRKKILLFKIIISVFHIACADTDPGTVYDGSQCKAGECIEAYCKSIFGYLCETDMVEGIKSNGI